VSTPASFSLSRLLLEQVVNRTGCSVVINLASISVRFVTNIILPSLPVGRFPSDFPEQLPHFNEFAKLTDARIE
jgi:hypothetical protein